MARMIDISDLEMKDAKARLNKLIRKLTIRMALLKA